MIHFSEKKNHLKNLAQNPGFNRLNIFLGFWALILIIFLLLIFFSVNPYFKFLGLIGASAIFFYLFLFRDSFIGNRFEKLQGNNNLFSLVEDLEEAALLFMEGKNREKFIFLLRDFFNSFLETNNFILFLKQDNFYRSFDLKSEKPGFKRSKIKIDKEWFKCLGSQSNTQIIDLSTKDEYRISSISGSEQFQYQSVIPLKVKGDLIGLVFFSSGKLKLTREEKLLLKLVSNKLCWLEKINRLQRKTQNKRKEYRRKSRQDKIETSLDEVEVKKRVFDLHSITQVANQLYLSLNKNRLFYNFTQSLQRQLNSKSVLIFLPEEKGKSLKARFSRGVDFMQFAEISLRKNESLYERFKEEQFPFYLYSVAEKYQENELIARLIAQGLQICYPLKLPEGKLGLVFLGGKIEGVRYREKDFLILNFLEDVLNTSLENIKQYNKLEELSYTDSLSGLYNFRYFRKRLNEEIFRAKRYQRNLALVIFDIDEFKIYNDSYGHQSGDMIIKQLGEEMVKVVRSIDIVCRYGGDEFCIIMPETNQEECFKFIERLRKHIQQHSFKNELLQLKHHLTLSAGAAIYPQHARSADRLIYCSDMALLKAKSSGRNKTNMYSGEEVGLKDTVSL